MVGSHPMSDLPGWPALWLEPLKTWCWDQGWEERVGRSLKFDPQAAWCSGYSEATMASSQPPGSPASQVPALEALGPLTPGNSWCS